MVLIHAYTLFDSEHVFIVIFYVRNREKLNLCDNRRFLNVFAKENDDIKLIIISINMGRNFLKLVLKFVFPLIGPILLVCFYKADVIWARENIII